MSSELERLRQSGRKMNLFWLAVTCFSLAYCLFAAFTDQPTILHTWRGAALAVLSSLFLFWYAIWFWSYVYNHRRFSGSWPPPLWLATLRWGITFALICALAALHPVMGWLFWTAFGLSFGLFGPPWLLAPVVLSSLGISYTLLVTANAPPEATPWILISMGLVLLCMAYMSYLPGRLIRERIGREHVFSDLQDAHRQLAEAHRQLELSAEREAEMAVLAERGRLAREMHDTIGHALVLIAVKLEAAQRLRAVNAERADHEIEVTKEVVRSTMNEFRASLANLRSPVGIQQSVAEMLARRAREGSERAGFHAIYLLSSDLGELCAATREALYRVGAEALTNVEKHARARRVTLSLSRQNDMITLCIEDDGVGLPVPLAAGQRSGDGEVALPSSPPGHYGLTGMRERIEALGGRFSLASRSGGGTIVEASIPLLAALI